jgi:thiol-disulfide isomerase/thioredoxin
VVRCFSAPRRALAVRLGRRRWAALPGITPLLWLLLAAGAAVGTVPVMAPPLWARDLDGARHRVPDPEAKATVLLFLAHDCPISNRYLPEIERLRAAYAPRGVRFFAVYAEPRLTPEQARRHRQDYAAAMPALLDAWRPLVRATGATVTPEAAVLGPDGTLLYRGRIDDLYAGFGTRRLRATRRELQAALEAILDGRPVTTTRTQAVGCFIAND